MTGFRVGYLVGPAALVVPMQEPRRIFTFCAPTASQHAAVARSKVRKNVSTRSLPILPSVETLMQSLDKAGIPYPYPAGAFFVFADIRALGMSSADFAVKALQEAGVLVFPGTQYGSGGEGFLRISYLAEIPDIVTAVEKLGQVYQASLPS